MGTPEARLIELGTALPTPTSSPAATYVGAVTVGQLVFVSGHGPYRDGGYAYRGSSVPTWTSPPARRRRA